MHLFYCELSLLTPVAEVVVPRPYVVVISRGEPEHQPLEGRRDCVEEWVDGPVDPSEGVCRIGAPREALEVTGRGIGQGHVQGGHVGGHLGPVWRDPEHRGTFEHGGFVPRSRVVGERVGRFHHVAAIGACLGVL